MAATPPRGYATLHWNHDRALEAEAELAAWLCRAHPGKVIPTGLGPSFRERFKQKFPIDVFSTPDLVYVPEFRSERGEITGYGPPLAFDVVERPNYAWKGGFSTILAQASKTDDLVRFDKKNSFLAYKWKDSVWTFARIEDVASLNLKPKLVDTVIGGERSRQKNYDVPRGLWYGKEEFKTLMLEKIRNFEPIDSVKLLGEIGRAREEDMRMHVGVLRTAFGPERLREVAKYIMSGQPMIVWDPKRELEPSIYVFQRVLRSALEKKRQPGLGAITDIIKDKRVLAVHIDKKGIVQKFKRAIMKSAIAKVFKRHEGRWASIRTLAREISKETGVPFSERRVRAMMREIGFGQFKRDAKGRLRVFISSDVPSAIIRRYHLEGDETPTPLTPITRVPHKPKQSRQLQRHFPEKRP